MVPGGVDPDPAFNKRKLSPDPIKKNRIRPNKIKPFATASYLQS